MPKPEQATGRTVHCEIEVELGWLIAQLTRMGVTDLELTTEGFADNARGPVLYLVKISFQPREVQHDVKSHRTPR